jgi:hypothetical protein
VLELLHDRVALDGELIPDFSEPALQELPDRARVAADGLLVKGQNELLGVDLARLLELVEYLEQVARTGAERRTRPACAGPRAPGVVPWAAPLSMPSRGNLLIRLAASDGCRVASGAGPRAAGVVPWASPLSTRRRGNLLNRRPASGGCRERGLPGSCQLGGLL